LNFFGTFIHRLAYCKALGLAVVTMAGWRLVVGLVMDCRKLANYKGWLMGYLAG
jgi:hypothetical protein